MFKNFKKTWWIILLMFIEVLSIAIISSTIDYVLTHPDTFSDLLLEETSSGYTYGEFLFVIHTAYITCLIVGLLVSIWFILFKLYDKRTKHLK